MEAIRRELAARRAEIAHIKLIIGPGGESVTGNVTSNDGPASRRQSRSGHKHAAMRINARVHIGPDELQAIVEGVARGGRRSKSRPR